MSDTRSSVWVSLGVGEKGRGGKRTSGGAVKVDGEGVHPKGDERGEGFEVADCEGDIVVVCKGDREDAVCLRGPIECALDRQRRLRSGRWERYQRMSAVRST